MKKKSKRLGIWAVVIELEPLKRPEKTHNISVFLYRLLTTDLLFISSWVTSCDSSNWPGSTTSRAIRQEVV